MRVSSPGSSHVLMRRVFRTDPLVAVITDCPFRALHAKRCGLICIAACASAREFGGASSTPLKLSLEDS